MVPWHSASNSSSTPFMFVEHSTCISQGSSRTPWQTIAQQLRGPELWLEPGSPPKKTLTCFSSCSIARCSRPTPTLPFLKASPVTSSVPFLGLHFCTSCDTSLYTIALSALANKAPAQEPLPFCHLSTGYVLNINNDKKTHWGQSSRK